MKFGIFSDIQGLISFERKQGKMDVEWLEKSTVSLLFTDFSPLSQREWPFLSSFHSLLVLSISYLLLCLIAAVKSVVTDANHPFPLSSICVHISKVFHHSSIIFLSASILFHFYEDYRLTETLPDGENYCRETLYSRHLLPFFFAHLLALVDTLFGSLTSNSAEINFFSFETHLFNLWKAWFLARWAPHVVLWDVFLVDCLSLAVVHSVKLAGASNRKKNQIDWTRPISASFSFLSSYFLIQHLSKSPTLLCVQPNLLYLFLLQNLAEVFVGIL
jgi:hypothetical protein